MSRFNRLLVAFAFCSTVVWGATLPLRSSTTAAQNEERAAAKFEVYKDRGGEFRWRLRATNTQILATSGDSYKAKRDCLHAIESVKKVAANAPVEEVAEGAAAGGAAPAKP